MVQECKEFSVFFTFPDDTIDWRKLGLKTEVQLLKASIGSSTCLVSKACKCKHKLLFDCVSM